MQDEMEQPDKRAIISTTLGLLSMVLASGGCCTCGGSWLLAAVMGAIAFMLGRAALALQPHSMSATSAYARVGLYSGLAGSIFGAGSVVLVLVNLIAWWLGIWRLANL